MGNKVLGRHVPEHGVHTVQYLRRSHNGQMALRPQGFASHPTGMRQPVWHLGMESNFRHRRIQAAGAAEPFLRRAGDDVPVLGTAVAARSSR